MRDVEDIVFTQLRTAVLASPLSYRVSMGTVPPPLNARFPYLHVACRDQSAARRYMTAGNPDFARTVMIEVNAYSDSAAGKTQVREIMSVVDKAMTDMGWRLSYHSETPYTVRDVTRLIHRFQGTAAGAYNGDDDLFVVVPC